MQKRLIRLGTALVALVAITHFLGLDQVVLAALTLGAGVSVFGIVMDKRSTFATALVIPTATGRALFGDVYDLTQNAVVVPRPIGTMSKPVYLVIIITTAVTSAGAADVTFELASDAQAAIAVDGTATSHWISDNFPKASLVAGFAIVLPLPGFKPDYERFLGVITNPGVAALTGGAASAFLTHDPKQWVALDNAIPAP